MKRAIAILVLIMLLTSGIQIASATPDLTINAKFDPSNPEAMRTTILEIQVRNEGTTASSPCIATLNWTCCDRRSYEVPRLEPGDYKTITDILIFPDAGDYHLKLKADSNDRITESNETNNTWSKNITVPLPSISAPSSHPTLDLEEEPPTPIFCPDTDLMKIGREKNSTGGYDRDSEGKLLRDPSNSSIWLPRQTGNGCGSTCLAYILRYLTGREYTQDVVDDEIRCTWGDGSFTDPFMAAGYAKDQPRVDARVYVDGSFHKLEWFIDNEIPVMIAISTTGSTSVMDGHWIVPVSYCMREKGDAPGTYEKVFGIYNPWGYQYEIPQEKLEQYWGRQDLGKIPLWNRAYVAVYNEPAPSGMPASNIDGWTNIKMNAASSISELLVGLEDIGDGFGRMFSGGFGNFFAGIGDVIVGIGEAIIGLAGTIFYGLIAIIGQVLSWIWDVLRSFGCWIYGLFGGSCEGSPHYYRHSLFSSHPCCEGSVFLNELTVNELIGYIYNTSDVDRNGLWLYAMLSNGEIDGYAVSSAGGRGGTIHNGKELELMGLVGYTNINISGGVDYIDLGDCLRSHNIEVLDNVGFVRKYMEQGTALLWLFEDEDGKGYTSRDPCAGTRSFPFALSGKDDVIYWIYTRQHIIGYIYMNEVEGSVPLFRFYDHEHQTFYPTTNLTEGFEKGYTFSGLVGYVRVYCPEEVKRMPLTHLLPEKGGCCEGEVPLYRYRNKDTNDYVLSAEELPSSEYEREAWIGCVARCKQPCTTELWLYCAQEIKKE